MRENKFIVELDDIKIFESEEDLLKDGQEEMALDLAGYVFNIQDLKALVGMDGDEKLIRNGGPGSGNHGHAGRPGAVGGSSSSSESKQIEKLKSVEKNIRNNDYETFVAVSPSGKVLLNKKGTKSEVLISKQEIEDMSRANNVIFTHNHPSSTSFSLNDMHMGMSINAKEIRIVSKKYTYSLKPPKISMSLVGPRDNHWPNPENLNNIMKEQESINYDKLVPKVQSGEISTETAWLTHTHNVIKSTAKTFEMEYSRMEVK